MTLRERLEHIATFIIAIALIIAAVPLVTVVNNHAFAAFAALLIGGWLYMMYCKFLD